MQHIIWPWNVVSWESVKEKIINQPFTSIIDLDNRISTKSKGRIKLRSIAEIFRLNPNIVDVKFLIDDLLPFMQKLLDVAPKTFKNIKTHILRRGESSNLAFNRLQAATIMVCLFFDILDYNYITAGKTSIDNMPFMTMENIIEKNNVFAMECLIAYFHHVYCIMLSNDDDERMLFNIQQIIIIRQTSRPPAWHESNLPLEVEIIGSTNPSVNPNANPSANPSTNLSTNLSTNRCSVVYSGEYVGGESLFDGPMSQEMISMLTYPEIILASMFCESIDHNEAIAVVGATLVSGHTGYGNSISRISTTDTVPIGHNVDYTEAARQRILIFIDASPRMSGKSQFITDFDRDLNKAYSGFTLGKFTTQSICTGNWTHSNMGNNIQLKFIQQLLAASLCNKKLLYIPNSGFNSSFTEFIDWLKRTNINSGTLYIHYKKIISQMNNYSRLNDMDIFKCLIDGYY